MQNLSNLHIVMFPLVIYMSRTGAQDGLYTIFKDNIATIAD